MHVAAGAGAEFGVDAVLGGDGELVDVGAAKLHGTDVEGEVPVVVNIASTDLEVEPTLTEPKANGFGRRS